MSAVKLTEAQRRVLTRIDDKQVAFASNFPRRLLVKLSELGLIEVSPGSVWTRLTPAGRAALAASSGGGK